MKVIGNMARFQISIMRMTHSNLKESSVYIIIHTSSITNKALHFSFSTYRSMKELNHLYLVRREVLKNNQNEKA